MSSNYGVLYKYEGCRIRSAKNQTKQDAVDTWTWQRWLEWNNNSMHSSINVTDVNRDIMDSTCYFCCMYLTSINLATVPCLFAFAKNTSQNPLNR